MSRAFGDKSLKIHMTSEPHVTVKMIDDGGEFVILASDGLWKVKDLIKWLKHHMIDAFLCTHLMDSFASNQTYMFDWIHTHTFSLYILICYYRSCQIKKQWMQSKISKMLGLQQSILLKKRLTGGAQMTSLALL